MHRLHVDNSCLNAKSLYIISQLIRHPTPLKGHICIFLYECLILIIIFKYEIKLFFFISIDILSFNTLLILLQYVQTRLSPLARYQP